MKFLVFLALFSVLSSVYCDAWVDIAPENLNDFEVNQALNWGAQNLTQDAIAKGHLPEGTYRVSEVQSAQKWEDITDNDSDLTDDWTDDNTDSWDDDYRFVVEVSNDEGSGWNGNYTVHLDAKVVNGQTVYSFHLRRFSYNWWTNLDNNEFPEDNFEWEHDNELEWATEDDVESGAEAPVENVDSGNEAVVDQTDSDDGDDLVLVVNEDGSSEWVNPHTLGVDVSDLD